MGLAAALGMGALAAAQRPASAAISGQSASNDATSVFYSYQFTGTPSYRRVYIDTDRSAATGFAQGGIGANYLLENASLYRYVGPGWSWQFVKTVTFSATGGTAKWTVARADIGETATPNDSDLVFQTEAPLVTSPKLTHVYSGAPAGPSASNDGVNVFYSYPYAGTPSWKRAYIDTDRDPATGFAQGGIGANYLLENASLYRYVGPGWSWQFVKTVTFSATGGTAKWTVARADIGETATPNDADIVFQTEAPLTTLPRLTHVYSGTVTVSYAQSGANFANPERGFYHHSGDCDGADFVVSTLQGYRVNEGITLLMCIYYLDGFQAAPISQVALDKLQSQLGAVRDAGLKAILRFAYTKSTAGNDAPLAQVLSHLDQLAPVLAANSDVIYVMPTGFIGAWGEGYFTQNFGNLGVVTPQDFANRKAVTDKVLAVLPPDRMTQLRTPLFKRTMYGPDPLPPAQAFTGVPTARIGHHNDCFLASDNDYGTYSDTAVEYPYLSADTTFVAMGGETCVPNPPRSLCPTALSELGLFHWSYVNIDAERTTIGGWSSGGCLPEITNRLGYRFALLGGAFPTVASAGGDLPVSLTIRNDGWSSPFNPRPIELWLRETTTGALQRLALAADPRLWSAGATVTISQTLTLPATLAPGSYALLLNLPDPAATLASRPEYAIRMANAGLWEPTTGANSLSHTVVVM